MEEAKMLPNLDEEMDTLNLDDELRGTMAEFMVGVIKFEELVEVGCKFLLRFKQALDFLQRPSIYESDLVKSILKENQTKRVNTYIQAGCTNSYDGTQSITQMNTSLSEIQNCLTRSKNIVDELENLVDQAGNALCTNGNYKSEDCFQGSEKSEKLDAVGCASFMAVVYDMIKQDYGMQEKIVCSLNLKCSSGEMESYCLMWKLRPFVNDDVIHQALRQVK